MDKNIIKKAKSSTMIPGLDILKFVMSLFIVAIHSEAVKGIDYVSDITR